MADEAKFKAPATASKAAPKKPTKEEIQELQKQKLEKNTREMAIMLATDVKTATAEAATRLGVAPEDVEGAALAVQWKVLETVAFYGGSCWPILY